MNAQIAMNTVTIKPTPLLDKLRLISQMGFSGIGLWMDEIQEYLNGGRKKPIGELLAEYALTPVEMQLIRIWQYLAGSEREHAFSRARDFFAKVRELDVHCPVVAVSSEEVGEIGEATEDFRRLCGLAHDFGIDVAFEFTGFAQQINNVKTAWDIVGGADCPNGGLLIDTFHFVKGGSTIEDLERVPMEKVFLVHINDVRSLPHEIKQQSRRFRFFPGEGEAPLKEFVGCLAKNGYNGFYCCEIFNERYWLEDPLEILKKSKQSMEDLLRSAGGG